MVVLLLVSVQADLICNFSLFAIEKYQNNVNTKGQFTILKKRINNSWPRNTKQQKGVMCNNLAIRGDQQL